MYLGVCGDIINSKSGDLYGLTKTEKASSECEQEF